MPTGRELSSCKVVGGLALLASTAWGCSLEEVDSDAVRTHGMYAEMVALAPGDGTTLVRVSLTVGGRNGTNVRLVGDDQLIARVDEVPGALSRRGRGRYEHELNGDAAGEVEVELQRGVDDDSASSSAVLPEPFAMSLVTDPRGGISRSEEVSVIWDEGARDIDWRVEGRCIWTESGSTFDDGRFSLEPGTLRVRGSRTGEECEVSLTLDRAREGDVDRVFIPGSSFRAIQRRRIVFRSLPGADEVPAEEPAPDAG
jgi:hypothetical protein